MRRRDLRAKDFLRHMLEATELMQVYMRGKTYKDFLEDQFFQDAVIRRIDVLGQAAKYVLEEAPHAAARFPDIPFHAIYGMRNWLTHAYFAIDEGVVWKSVEDDLTDLQVSLSEALRSIEDEPLQ